MAAGPWAAVLFDLDGTLADSVGLILECYRHTMRVHLGTVPEDGRWLAGLGTPLAVQLAEFARSAEEVAAMVRTYVSHQRQVHDDMVRPYPGVRPVLDALAAAGVGLAVVTSKRHEMATRTMQRCGLAGLFAVVVTPDEVTRAKPDPAPVQAALAALGVGDPRQALFVGDAPVDIQAGRAAGARTAAALWGAFPRVVLEATAPDYLLAAPEAILDLAG